MLMGRFTGCRQTIRLDRSLETGISRSRPLALGTSSLLDHSPANALGGLAAAEEIAGRWADLEGTEAAHHMHSSSWPAQVWLQNRPVVNQLNRPLLVQLTQQRVLAHALAMPRGKPDPIR